MPGWRGIARRESRDSASGSSRFETMNCPASGVSMMRRGRAGRSRGQRRAGFDDVSLDLMMWLPGQSVAEWLESIDALIALDPDHASLYLLEVYPNAPLREEMARRFLDPGAG